MLISFYIMSYCISYTFILPALDMSSDLPTLTFKKKTAFFVASRPVSPEGKDPHRTGRKLDLLVQKGPANHCCEKQPGQPGQPS